MLPQARISSDARFQWVVAPNYFDRIDSDSDDSDEDENNEPSEKKMRKTQQREEQKQQELKIRKLREDLIQIEIDPQNPDHFERLLLSNPNSAITWIRYMACYIQAKDVEKARATAKRALTIIDAREEQEKISIWTSLLILEELYGTKESFKQTMDEALRSNNEYYIYMKILEMFTDSKRLKGLDKLIAKINRKFSDSIEAYIHCATVYFKKNKSGKARFILQKALSTLPTESHVSMISQFALVENSNGSPEEAQTLFEHVLTCYPSRIDIWSVYIDMLIKSNRIDLARCALEKAAIQKLSPKKMKSLFNKWLMLEEKYGTSESIDKVKECMNSYFD
ncbi:protein RRP5 homolog [Metopolophium dirhodum]|uniref:protein RRP5 homolog n=1 Tax=Metopolophium dirhodum TaxID=44670 RepID=UPI00299057A5|nr:protein RRP5 homolog [Metopolophium dirhodum]